MTAETYNGLHKCQPKNQPTEGEVKNMVVLHMPAKNGKKAWIKIKSEQPEKGGTPFRIISVTDTGWEPDTYGNLAFNIEVEPAINNDFQKAKATMQRGDEHGISEVEESGGGSSWEQEDAQRAAANAPGQPTTRANEDDGVVATRKHLMQSANLLVLCIKATEKAVAPHQPVVAQTSEQFQSDVAKLFIEASGRRTTDGVNWWSYIDKMPTHPIKNG